VTDRSERPDEPAAAFGEPERGASRARLARIRSMQPEAACSGAKCSPAETRVRPGQAWPHAEKRRLELLKEAYGKARYSLEWTISREDLEVLAQRIAVLRERTAAVCQAYIESLHDHPALA
jgi:hypothetical protein